MYEFFTELAKLLPQWFLMLCIIFFGVGLALKHMWKCVERLLLRFDLKEKQRSARYDKIHEDCKKAIDNNTNALKSFENALNENLKINNSR